MYAFMSLCVGLSATLTQLVLGTRYVLVQTSA